VAVEEVLKDSEHVVGDWGSIGQVLGSRIVLSIICIIFTLKLKTEENEKQYAEFRAMTYMLLFSSNIVLSIYLKNKRELKKYIYLTDRSTCV
jgi:hypothetical protein